MPVTALNRVSPVVPGDPTQVPIRRYVATTSNTDDLVNHARGFRVFTTAGNVAYLNWAGEECFATACQLYADTITQIKRLQVSNALGTTTAAGFEILE